MATKAPKFDLETLILASGSHSDHSSFCVMEAVAYFAGEPWSDHPRCASRTITGILIRLNDRWTDEDRQLLKPYIPRLVGTAGDDATERRRAYMAVDWAARVGAPIWLRRAGMDAEAEMLEALPLVDDAASAKFARVALNKVRDLAWAKRRERLDVLQARVRAEVAAKRPADADAVAVAVAAAVAAAAAAADAVADAAAAAAAVAVADADAAAAAVAVRGSKEWWSVYNAAYAAARKVYDEALAGVTLRPTVEASHRSVLGLVDALIEVGAVAA